MDGWKFTWTIQTLQKTSSIRSGPPSKLQMFLQRVGELGWTFLRQCWEYSSLRVKKITGGLQARMGEYSRALGGFGFKESNMSIGVAIWFANDGTKKNGNVSLRLLRLSKRMPQSSRERAHRPITESGIYCNFIRVVLKPFSNQWLSVDLG